MQDCLFCHIIDRKIAANIIYEDEKVIAFDDVQPQAPHHKLIVPRKHIATLNDIAEEDVLLLGSLLYTAQHLAKQLGTAETGYRVAINCNKDGGQAIYHIHVHLLGGRHLAWPPG
jgi:histidine triad (HIT) family protein